MVFDQHIFCCTFCSDILEVRHQTESRGKILFTILKIFILQRELLNERKIILRFKAVLPKQCCFD